MYFDKEPLYPFGYGLSYTEFKYRSMKVDKKSICADEELHVDVKIENTGCYDGDEVVQLYAKLPGDDAKFRLKAFSRDFIMKGETKTIRLKIKASDLSLWNESNQCFELPKGKMCIMVGSSSENIKLKEYIVLK